MRNFFIILIAMLAGAVSAQTFQSVDITTHTTNSVYSSGQITLTNTAPMTNAFYVAQNTSNVVVGDSFPVAFGKINSNFGTVSNYMATNGTGGASQTPWTSDINAANHSVSNVNFVDLKSGYGHVKIWGDASVAGNGTVYITQDPYNSMPYGEFFTTVIGGDFNDVGSYKSYSTVIGGFHNTIGDDNNGDPGNYSFIAGGLTNKIYGDYSFAAGRNVTINHNNVFMWNDGANGPKSSTANDTFVIWATNGIWLNGSQFFNGGPPFDPSNLSTNIYGGKLSILGTRVQSSDSIASQYSDTAFGFSTADGTYSFAAGQSQAHGTYSAALAEGEATGADSFAVGAGSIAAGDNSYAMGINAEANHNNSFVWSDGSGSYGFYLSPTNNTFNARAANGFHFDGGPVYFNGVSLTGNASNSIFSQFENSFSKLYVSGGAGLYTNYNGIYNNSGSGFFTNVTSGWILAEPGTLNYGSTNILIYTLLTNLATFSFPAVNYPGFSSPFLISTNYQCMYIGSPLSVAIYNPGATDTAFGFPTNTLGTHGLTMAFTNGLFMGVTPY